MKMKNSGVDWIGNIPSEWECVPLKSISYLITDGTHQTPEYIDEGVPFLSIKDISSGHLDFSDVKYISQEKHEELAKHANVEKGDVLFTRIGTLGVAAVVDTDTIFDIFVSVGLIKVNTSRVINKWLAYNMISPHYYQYIQMVKAGGGTTAAKFNLGDVANSYIILPSINEQRQLTSFLDSKCGLIDSAINAQETIIERLKEYKSSIITEAVTKGINPDVKMKESGIPWIGKIPAHWDMVYAKQLFSQRKERAYKTDIPLTASQDYGIISQSSFMELEGRQVVQVIKGEDILKHVEVGDFVISMRSFQGGLEYSEVSGKISSAYVMLIPNRKYVYDRYYKWLFKSNRYITALQGTSNLIRDGQALRFSNFVQVYLPKLSIVEQKQIADHLDVVCPLIDSEIERREMIVDKIKSYKKSLIYEVVTGKKEVASL